MKSTTLLFLLFMVSLTYGQSIHLSRKVQLDTLKVWMEFSPEMAEPMKSDLDSIFRMTITEFNRNNSSFVIAIDSSRAEQFLFMKMGAVHYVDTKESVLTTGLDMLLVTGHIAMIKNYGWTLPIWPILFPSTRSKIDLDFSAGLTANKFLRKMWVNPQGYFKSKEKQQVKFRLSFQKKFEQLWKRFEKQNGKNLSK